MRPLLNDPTMAKTNNGNGRKKKQQKSKNSKARASRPIAAARAALDAHATAWTRLLKDPCGAPLVPSCYTGIGTGLYLRCRRSFSIGSTDTAGVFCAQLGTNTVYSFGTSTGAVITMSGGIQCFIDTGNPALTDRSEFRCIGGCMRVRYIGAESSRAGTIGLLTGPPVLFPLEAAGINVPTFNSNLPVVMRTGEVMHEVLFSPLARDEQFQSAPGSGPATFSQDKCTFTMSYLGVPGGSLTIEVTGIYEYEGGISTGLLKNAVPAPSVNTMNRVLLLLGPTLDWAYGMNSTPVIKAVAGAAGAMYKSGVGQAAMSGLRYLAAM